MIVVLDDCKDSATMTVVSGEAAAEEDETMQAEWKKLENGTWGVMVECGGRGAVMVGQMVVVRRKDRTSSNVTLGALVQDWGKGDWALFQADR